MSSPGPAAPDRTERAIRIPRVNGVAVNYPHDLSVVIPIYNEKDGIGNTVANLKEYLGGQPWRSQIPCVDDGSTDGTAAVLERMAGVTVISSPDNRGYGAALRRGFAGATGRYIGFVDADQTYPVKMIGPMLAMLESRTDVLLCAGSRLLGRGDGLTMVRKAGNVFFTVLSRILCQTYATDVCSGMLLFRRELLEEFDVQLFTDDLDFSLQMRCRCALQDIPSLELPIPYGDRAGESKLAVFRHGLIFTRRIVRERLAGRQVKRLT